MRIGLVSQEYPPETAKGGIGSQTFLKARGLAGLGHEIHVFSRSSTNNKTELREGSIITTRVPGAEMAVYTEVADWVTYSSRVAEAISEIHAQAPLDIIDFPEWGCEGFVHLINQTEWNRIPTVLHLHGPLVMFSHTIGWPEIDSEFYRVGTAMEGTCLRLADAIFSSSQCSAEWCSKHYGLRRKIIPVIHTGVDTQLFSPRAVSPVEHPTIIFVGKLARNKGVLLLVEAACKLAPEFPGLQVRLLGRGDSKIIDEIQAIARASATPDIVDLPGFIQRSDLPEHLSRAHVFAAPSQYEGGPGFVYLEAMACGLPVVACAGSGASEVVRDGDTGLLVPPCDIPSLVNALRSLLSDPVRSRAMGQAAREFVLAEADSNICLKKIEAFYAAVARKEMSAHL